MCPQQGLKTPDLGERNGAFPQVEDWFRAWGFHRKQHPYISKSGLQRYFIKRLQQFGRNVTLAPLPRPIHPLVFIF